MTGHGSLVFLLDYPYLIGLNVLVLLHTEMEKQVSKNYVVFEIPAIGA